MVLLMTLENSNALMYRIVTIKDNINRLASNVKDIDYIFDYISLEMPKLSHPELGFIRIVSWLYVLYYEAGKINVDFISQRFEAYNIDSDENLKMHFSNVHDLRTFLQHNLNSDREHDSKIDKICTNWFKRNCSTWVPNSDSEWESCLESILLNSIEFLKGLESCFREIEKDDSYTQIVEQWVLKRQQYHPPHDFERMIQLTANDMGRDNIDSKKICNKYMGGWKNELGLLKSDYDFAYEVRRRVENVLLNDVSLIITGKDIIDRGITPGPDVAVYLKKADLIYKNSENTFSKEELLDNVFSA
jgi:hypothetical protein